MVCILDREGRIVGFDEGCERVTGFSAAEVIGRDARDIVIPPEEADDFDASSRRSGRPATRARRWATGSRATATAADLVVEPADRGDDGEVTQLFTVGIDLTERERANAELRAVTTSSRSASTSSSSWPPSSPGLRRVALLVAGEASPETVVFDAVAAEVARVFGAESAAIARFDDERTATFVGRWNAVRRRCISADDPARSPRRLRGGTRRPHRRPCGSGATTTSRARSRSGCASTGTVAQLRRRERRRAPMGRGRRRRNGARRASRRG